MRVRLPIAAALAAAVALAAVLTVDVGAGHAAGMPSPLPRIGAAQVVDQNDVGDPFILRAGTTYYLFGTTDWQSNVPTATSPTCSTGRRRPTPCLCCPPGRRRRFP